MELIEAKSSEMDTVLFGSIGVTIRIVEWISGIGFRVENFIVLEHCCSICFISESALFRFLEISWRRDRRFNWRPDWRRSERAGGLWVGGDCGIILKQLSDMLGEPNKIRWNWRFV